MSDNKELDDLLIDSSSPEQSKEDIQKYLEKKQAAYDALEASADPIDRARCLRQIQKKTTPVTTVSG